VYVAAAKHTGLARYEALLADLFGEVASVGGGDGFRVLAATGEDGPDEGFEPPRCATVREFDTTVATVDLSLVSVPGVFSASRLDDGTRLLAASADVADGERVLDLYCGYGALGATAALSADCEVWLSDDDRVATACAERTLEANGAEGTVVTAPELRGVPDEFFDRILCNPPTHATDEVLEGLFTDARRALRSGGEMQVVHHSDLDLRPQLSAFGTVEQVGVSDEHIVVCAR
jgi:16S rRNA (guanine1207-N2)-methyltransferase